MATELETDIQSEAGKCSKKRRKRNRFIKQGYHRSERDDARRVAARTFLLGIPLDNQTQYNFSPSESFQSQLESQNTLLTQGPPPHNVTIDVIQRTPANHDILGSPKYSHKKLSPIHLSHSLGLEYSPPDRVFYEPNDSFADRRYSTVNELGGSVCVCHNLTRIPPTMLLDKCLMFTCGGNSPSAPGSVFAVTSVISYKREEEQDVPLRTRVRANSMSLQIDLDVDLGTTSSDNIEASLGFLFQPLWVSDHTTSDLTPPLLRKLSAKKDRLSDPQPIRAYHWKSAAHQPIMKGVYPWAFFKDNHTPAHVIIRYHPQCLDNSEYFVGSQTHSFLLEGKRVSIIQYARPCDIKKAINDQFAIEFPYIRITLSKLRRLKRDMHKAAEECDVDLEAVAYSYVYFEKLILMGKINKANRKIIAGVCVLLAAKFYTDVRQKDIKNFVERLADQFHLSTKELILYELPVLVSLQFSLLVPYYQAHPHLLALRDSELALN